MHKTFEIKTSRNNKQTSTPAVSSLCNQSTFKFRYVYHIAMLSCNTVTIVAVVVGLTGPVVDRQRNRYLVATTYI